MGILSTVLQPLGAIFGQKVPASSSSTAALNTSGSAYNLGSNNTAAPLINTVPSTTQWLIIGAVVLGGIFLFKRK
jgi:hypothetical protein